MNMMGLALGNTFQKGTEPEARGERVAAYVEGYFAFHPGLSLGELAFRLKADKRDLQRLLRDRSSGWRLEDRLAAYFGHDFVETIFAPVVGDGPSIRERELERERAELAARRDRLDRDRARRRDDRSPSRASLRVASEQDGRPGL